VYVQEASMRDAILAKRQLAKDGGAGGSGPRGGMIEDPKISGPKAPADSLPAQPNGRKVVSPITPADAIYAGIRAAALRAAPTGTSEAQAIAAYLSTSEGQAAHARWNAARQKSR
jgi:ABC-type Fe3+ transport system substrate-binding protein